MLGGTGLSATRTTRRKQGRMQRKATKLVRWTAAAVATAALAALPGSLPGSAVPIASVGEQGPTRVPGTYPGLDIRGESGIGEVVVEQKPTRPVAQVIWTTDPATASDSTAAIVSRLGTSGIPEVALKAYMRAQQTTAVTDPGCGISWSLLAAIGRVESNHGRYGGAELREDGYGTRKIRGIPLDGRPGIALIRDTDDGVIDGDAVYDRAAGPMQFIPSSWKAVAADGNGDGRKDPDNMFDAALGSATYLCAGNGNLRDIAQRRQAVFRYNHSQEYVDMVISLAEAYERGQVTPLPHQEPSANPPAPLPTPPVPPAHPPGPSPGLEEPTPPVPPRPPPTTPPRPGPTCPPATTTPTSTSSSSTSSTTSTTLDPRCPVPPTTTTTTTTAPATTTTATTAAPATETTAGSTTSAP